MREQDGAALRRASYGSGSPTVGLRGAETRDRILETTFRLFRTMGYQATTIDDIASALGVSRATVYQYFTDREQIYHELLQHNGAEIMRLVRHLGELGPTVNGFLHLRWWVFEFARLYDQHSIVFQVWATAANVDREVTQLAGELVGEYTEHFSRRLPPVNAIDPRAISIVTLALIDGVNSIRSWLGRALGIADEALTENVALLLQTMLFPGFDPGEAGVELLQVETSKSQSRERQVQRIGTAQRPRVESRRLTPAAGRIRSATVAELNEHGYEHTTVSGIIKRAQLSRTAFYRNYANVHAVLADLVEECREDLVVPFDDFRELGAETELHTLREWFEGYFQIYWQHAQTLALWSDLLGSDADLRAAARSMFVDQLFEFESFLNDRPLPPGVDAMTAACGLVGILQRLPLYSYRFRDVLDINTIAESATALIHRGLFEGAVTRS